MQTSILAKYAYWVLGCQRPSLEYPSSLRRFEGYWGPLEIEGIPVGARWVDFSVTAQMLLPTAGCKMFNVGHRKI